MSVQGDYRVPGMRTAEVRELQRMIGVTVDGAWGNQSQAALDKLYGTNADPLKVFKGPGGTTGQSGTGAASAGQQYSQPESPNGYTGSYYTKGGNTYTDYGALLRNDGFYYPPGAKISPNGMYVDVGNGWEFAKLGVAFDRSGRMLGYTPSSVTGLAPGARIPGFSLVESRYDSEPDSAEPEPDADQLKSEWESFFERELKRYKEELASYAE